MYRNSNNYIKKCRKTSNIIKNNWNYKLTTKKGEISTKREK